MEKLLFLYLITNPLTNISGVYELPLRRAAFDLGMSEKEVGRIFRKLETDGKIVSDGGWIGVVNFIKHQTLNPKVKQGIVAELKKAPRIVVDRLSIDYEALLHTNLNSNITQAHHCVDQLSTDLSPELKKKKDKILESLKM